MAKEFIVNNRKVMTVECDISIDYCPVAQMLCASKLVEPCTSSLPINGGCSVIKAESKNARKLNGAVVELCMNCDVNCR